MGITTDKAKAARKDTEDHSGGGDFQNELKTVIQSPEKANETAFTVRIAGATV